MDLSAYGEVAAGLDTIAVYQLPSSGNGGDVALSCIPVYQLYVFKIICWAFQCMARVRFASPRANVHAMSCASAGTNNNDPFVRGKRKATEPNNIAMCLHCMA
jgi:hypothetical protein